MLHERIIVLHSPTDILSHSPFKVSHSSSTFLGFFSLALSFSNFQPFSTGFMSGLWADNSTTVTSTLERNVWTDFAVWHGALSCINIANWLIAVLKVGTCFFNNSFYTVALILPFSVTKVPVPASEIMPNTTTLPPQNLTLLLVYWGEYFSLGMLRTNLLPSQPNRLNFDSSLKWPQSYCSSVHMTCSEANFNPLILFFLEM